MIKVFMVGNLTKDPELRQTRDGVNVCTFTVATNRAYDREKSDFFNVTAWRGLAELCSRYLAKGRKVAVYGRLENRSYEKNGETRWITEVQADDVEFITAKAPEMTEVEGDFPWE